MKKILKGILLWMTALAIMLFIGGIDSIADQGIDAVFVWLLLCVVLCSLCYKTISIRELYTLSGYKFFNKLIR